jgi:hypothetical protein
MFNRFGSKSVKTGSEIATAGGLFSGVLNRLGLILVAELARGFGTTEATRQEQRDQTRAQQ